MSVEILINTLILVISIVWLWLGSGVTQLIGVMVWTQMISAALGLFLLYRSQLLAGPQEPVSIRLTLLGQRLTPLLWAGVG